MACIGFDRDCGRTNCRRNNALLGQSAPKMCLTPGLTTETASTDKSTIKKRNTIQHCHCKIFGCRQFRTAKKSSGQIFTIFVHFVVVLPAVTDFSAIGRVWANMSEISGNCSGNLMCLHNICDLMSNIFHQNMKTYISQNSIQLGNHFS